MDALFHRLSSGLDSQIPPVQKATKKLLTECCERQGLTPLARETDLNHVHIFVSAPPRFSPAGMANLRKGDRSRYLRDLFPHLKRLCDKVHLWTQAEPMGSSVYYRGPRQVMALWAIGALIPIP